MSTHKLIVTTMSGIIDELASHREISATSIASIAFKNLGGDEAENSPLSYAAYEQFKVIARKCLVGRFNPLNKEDEDDIAQGSLLDDVLQARYPVPVRGKSKDGPKETRYKRLEFMTDAEIEWIADRFGRKSESEAKHRDRLLEYKANRVAPMVEVQA